MNRGSYAAQRDVDVKLILPGIPDKKLSYKLTGRLMQFIAPLM